MNVFKVSLAAAVFAYAAYTLYADFEEYVMMNRFMQMGEPVLQDEDFSGKPNVYLNIDYIRHNLDSIRYFKNDSLKDSLDGIIRK